MRRNIAAHIRKRYPSPRRKGGFWDKRLYATPTGRKGIRPSGTLRTHHPTKTATAVPTIPRGENIENRDIRNKTLRIRLPGEKTNSGFWEKRGREHRGAMPRTGPCDSASPASKPIAVFGKSAGGSIEERCLEQDLAILPPRRGVHSILHCLPGDVKKMRRAEAAAEIDEKNGIC